MPTAGSSPKLSKIAGGYRGKKMASDPHGAGVIPFPETSVSTHTCIIQINTHINKEKANL